MVPDHRRHSGPRPSLPLTVDTGSSSLLVREQVYPSGVLTYPEEVMSEFTEELLRDIDETTVEVFELGDRRQAKRTAKSQRKAYVRGVEEVRDIAGKSAARRLAARIRMDMRENERFPSARQVRQWGAELCRESGHTVSTGSWLGA